MKTCACGGTFRRMGTLPVAKGTGLKGQRYQCSVCKKNITVRGEEVSNKIGRPFVKDWRNEMGASQ